MHQPLHVLQAGTVDTCCEVLLGFVGVCQGLDFGFSLCTAPTSVQIFQAGQTFRLWVKSETSLCKEECKDEEARGLAFEVGFWG